ncbi:MAG: hypothetical protein GX902_11790 [Lentisphaerae bacterium]|nr:hypothetical protein [Lentisphaerota bacterium]
MTDANIRFGLGRRCTNPTMPVSLAGYFNIRMWDKVLDDLEVRALILEKDGREAAIIQFDLITTTTVLYNLIIDAIQAEFGPQRFTSENLIICCTHSHTAPEIRLKRAGCAPEYLPFAAAQAVAALKDAAANLQSGQLYGTLTRDARFIFNRRYWMQDGSVVTNPGKLNPNILRPEGEIDPEIPLLVIKKDSRPYVVISSIVNHTDTIGGCGVSADWPGFLRRTVESHLAPGAMLMPLVGCQGNINHFDVRSNSNQTCYAEAERIGLGYAETIEKAFDQLQLIKFKQLRTVSTAVIADPRQLTDAELAEAQAVMDKYPDVDISPESTRDLTSEDLAKKTPFALKYFASKLMEIKEDHDPRKFTLTGFELGSAFIASMPSEPFTENGLRVRKACFPQHLCLVTALANGTGNDHVGGGYIPNAWNYNRGGYETTPRSNPYAQDTAERLIAAWQKLAAKL